MFLGDDRICQVLFTGLELEDLLFDRILGDQLENADDLFLTDPVGTVRCLVLGSYVPPGVVMDHDIGAGQIQSGAAGFQRDQEERRIIFVELMDEAKTFFLGCGTGDLVVGE